MRGTRTEMMVVVVVVAVRKRVLGSVHGSEQIECMCNGTETRCG